MSCTVSPNISYLKKCKCGCGNIVKTKKALYSWGHNPLTQEHIRKVSINTLIDNGNKTKGILRASRETRFCACGCRGYFICRTKSNQRYIYQHQNIGKHFSVEERNKRSISAKNGKTGKWIRSEEDIKKLISLPCQRPNKFESVCMEYINSIYKNKFIYSGDGSFLVNNRSADAYSEELKTICLFNGCYWHLVKQGKKVTEENKRVVEQFESKPFIDGGYKVIFIWEDEIDLLLKGIVK
jgi:hypothetical protein